MWVGMTLKNHSYHYFVWGYHDRIPNEHDELHQEAGLTVSRIRKVDHDPLPQEKAVAYMTCSKQHPIIENWDDEFMIGGAPPKSPKAAQ